MKASIYLVFAFSLGLNIAMAQETHTPRFDCTNESDTSIKKYIMIGNSFEGDLNWSNEMYFVDQVKYQNQTFRETPKFLIDTTNTEGIFAVNPKDTNQYLILSDNYYLAAYHKDGVDTYNCVPTKYGEKHATF
ncbi:MAG: hypothetical protein VYA54_07875 [Bdellovibrionota bacterium]|nr:hypothetical protein [Bdellovibrionota bacterium]